MTEEKFIDNGTLDFMLETLKEVRADVSALRKVADAARGLRWFIVTLTEDGDEEDCKLVRDFEFALAELDKVTHG